MLSETSAVVADGTFIVAKIHKPFAQGRRAAGRDSNPSAISGLTNFDSQPICVFGWLRRPSEQDEKEVRQIMDELLAKARAMI